MVNGSVAQWDPRVSRVVHVRRVHRENVSAISWNDAGTHYISASRDQTLKLWDRRHELPLQVFQDTRAAHDGGDYTVCVAWNPQSAHVFASGSNEGTVTYWCCGSDANCGTTRHTSFVPSTLSRAPTPPGARCLLYDCKSETKEELVAPTGGCDTSDVKGDRAKEGTNDIRGDESRVTRAVEREIKHPSSASRRRVPTSGKIGEMLAAHCGRVSDLAFHPEGHVLCSVGGDATLKFWGGCYPDADFENCFEAHQLPPARQTELAPSEALVDSTDDSVIPRPASTGTHAAQALSDDAPFFS
jgi:polyadenylation factor subunit 2